MKPRLGSGRHTDSECPNSRILYIPSLSLSLSGHENLSLPGSLLPPQWQIENRVFWNRLVKYIYTSIGLHCLPLSVSISLQDNKGLFHCLSLATELPSPRRMFCDSISALIVMKNKFPLLLHTNIDKLIPRLQIRAKDCTPPSQSPWQP